MKPVHALFACLLAAPLAAQTTQRVTVVPPVNPADTGGGVTQTHAISGDGRYVVFESASPSYLPEDPFNPWPDVFVRDRTTGTVELESLATDGTHGNDESIGPVISRDGRVVAFLSLATNLAPGAPPQVLHAYVRDRAAGTTEMVSVASDGTPGDHGADNDVLALSDDGRYVAFESFSTNLVAGDTNGLVDVFVRDRRLGTTERVSVAHDGGQLWWASAGPAISGDGRFVVFMTGADGVVPGDDNHCDDVFVRDRVLGTTERVSVSSSGLQGNANSGWLLNSISADGRFVAFQSFAWNFVASDSNGVQDVFVRDRETQTTELVSVALAGGTGNGASTEPSISASGRYVAFTTVAGDIVPEGGYPSVKVCVRDRRTGTTTLASAAFDGSVSPGTCFVPTMSADERSVAFVSGGADLVPGDENLALDVFVRDLDGGPSFVLACEPGAAGVIGCPCANPPGGPGRGCDNSAATGGARLSAEGSTSLWSESLRFTTEGETSGVPSILVQGASIARGGVVYGQGVRCATGTLARLFTKTSTAGGIVAPDFSAGDLTVTVRSRQIGSPIAAGETRSYFVFYRDPVVLGGCPSSSTFNATPTGVVTWTP
jgi:Tol biopolymer transport system component